MLRAIIIDDESDGIRSLELLIKLNCNTLHVVATSSDPNEGIKLIENYQPDVVFLDISMPTMSGFEMLEKLLFRNFQLIFVSAHEEHAVKAIKKQAFDYLLKPVDVTELLECINRIPKSQKSTVQASDSIVSGLVEIAMKDGILFIKQSEIIRLEASGSYTIFYLDGMTRHVASKPLKEYEPKLNHELFFRCHNSHIVNLSKVIKFSNRDGYFALMSDGSHADISRKLKDMFLERIKNMGR